MYLRGRNKRWWVFAALALWVSTKGLKNNLPAALDGWHFNIRFRCEIFIPRGPAGGDGVERFMALAHELMDIPDAGKEFCECVNSLPWVRSGQKIIVVES